MYVIYDELLTINKYEIISPWLLKQKPYYIINEANEIQNLF
jgi:hypothetical protein